MGSLVALAFLFPAATERLARAAGYAVCHQWPEHSFAAAGQTFPLCARCTGTYAGALLTLSLVGLARRGKAADWPGKPALAVLAAGYLWMVVDGVNSFVDVLTAGQTHLYAPSNAIRFVTGGFNGMVMVGIGYPLLSYILWKDWASAPVFRSMAEPLAVLAGLGLMLAAIGASTEALVPAFSLMALAGIALLFTGINSALWLLVRRRERLAQTLGDALPALAVGLALTVSELAVVGLGRMFLEKYLLRLG